MTAGLHHPQTSRDWPTQVLVLGCRKPVSTGQERTRKACQTNGGRIPTHLAWPTSCNILHNYPLCHMIIPLYTYHILVTHVRYPTLATSYDHTTLSHDYTTLSHYHTTLSHDHLPHPHHTCNISHITWPHHSDTWPYHSVTWPHTRRLLLRLTHPRKNGVIF